MPELHPAAIGRAPRALWLVLGAWACILGAYLVFTPLYQGPDEPNHVDRILDTSSFAGFEDWDEGQMRPDVEASMRIWRCCFFPPPFGADAAPEHPRPSFRDLAPADPQDGVEQQTQHPPLYYAGMGAVRTVVTGMTPDDFWSADREVLLLRFLNALVVLPLPWLAWRAGRELGWSDAEALLAALVPLAVPQLGWIGATVNNDNLLALLGAVAAVASCRILRRGLDPGSAAVFGGSLALALMTKASALVLLPYAALVLLWCWRRHGLAWRSVALVGVPTVVGGWFYLRSVVLFGDPIASRGGPPDDPVDSVDLGAFVSNYARRTSSSFWGNFGWLTDPIPRWWSYLLAVLLVVLFLWVLVRPRQGELRVLLAAFGSALLLMLYATYVGHRSTGVYPAMQGRYFFIVIIPIAVCAAAPLTRWPQWARRGLSALVVLNFALGLVTLAKGFWRGGGLEKLDALTAWSPLGTLAAVILVGGAVAVPLLLLAVERWRPPARSPAVAP